jgi:GT2 family glycosyltransferase
MAVTKRVAGTSMRRSNIAVSVVIPTYNRLPRLRRVLEALREQVSVGDEHVEIIVISDGSEDGTDEYLASGETPVPIRFARQRNQGAAAARNHGIALARGEFVLFIDDDVVPLPGLVAEHLAVHREEGGNTVVLGPMLTPKDHNCSPWVAYEQAMLYKQYRAMRRGEWEPTARQFYTGNASIARRHLVESGGFDESLGRAEDVELAYRLAARGLRFVYRPSAAGLHYAERTYASWRDTANLYGSNDAAFALDRGQGWLLLTVARELRQHHPLVRLLANIAVRWPRAATAVAKGLDHAVTVMHRTGLGPARAALSAVFNLGYYRGLTDGLRSRQHDPRTILATGEMVGRADRPRSLESGPSEQCEETLGVLARVEALDSASAPRRAE